MFPNVMAVIIGIIAGLAVFMVCFMVGSYLLHTYGSRPEIGPFILMLLAGGVVGPLARSFSGAWVAARLGSSRPMLLAMIVGSSLTVVDLWGLTFVHTQPHWGLFPVLLNLGGAWVAGIMEQKRRAAAETPAPAPAEAGKAESDETKRQTLHKKDDSCSVT